MIFAASCADFQFTVSFTMFHILLTQASLEIGTDDGSARIQTQMPRYVELARMRRSPSRDTSSYFVAGVPFKVLYLLSAMD